MPSPDGQYALVAIVHRPFSYTFPYERFPLKTEVVPVKGAGAVKLLSGPRRSGQSADLAGCGGAGAEGLPVARGCSGDGGLG